MGTSPHWYQHALGLNTTLAVTAINVARKHEPLSTMSPSVADFSPTALQRC